MFKKLFKLKSILALVLIVFYALLLRPTQDHAFSLAFGDEQDNFAIGRFLLQGKILYKDIFINHQPIPPIVSAVIQKLTHPNGTFILIKHHREFMLLLSALTFLLLTIRFGYPGFVMGILYEFYKYLIFGNVFLSEPFAVPPVLYLTAMIYELSTHKIKSLHRLDLVFIPLALLGIIFNLLPLYPFVALALIYIFIVIPKKQKKSLAISGLVITFVGVLALSRFMDFRWYFHDNFIVNLFDFIPQQTGGSLWTTLGRMLLFPLLLFNQPHKDFYLLFQIISAFYLLTLGYSLYKKKYVQSLLSYLILITLNMRPLPLGEIYGGFHFLPLFSAFSFLTIMQIGSLNFPLGKIKLGIIKGASFVLIPLVAFSFGSRELFPKTSPPDNWYVNYSPFFDYGETIRILSKPQDTIIAIPDAPLIVWQSKLMPSTRYYFLYGFMEISNDLRNDILSQTLKNPPTFIYSEFGLPQDKIFTHLYKDYQPIRHGTSPIKLYVRKDDLKNISAKQWQDVQRFNFQKLIKKQL